MQDANEVRGLCQDYGVDLCAKLIYASICKCMEMQIMSQLPCNNFILINIQIISQSFWKFQVGWTDVS